MTPKELSQLALHAKKNRSKREKPPEIHGYTMLALTNNYIQTHKDKLREELIADFIKPTLRLSKVRREAQRLINTPMPIYERVELKKKRMAQAQYELELIADRKKARQKRQRRQQKGQSPASEKTLQNQRLAAKT